MCVYNVNFQQVNKRISNCAIIIINTRVHFIILSWKSFFILHFMFHSLTVSSTCYSLISHHLINQQYSIIRVIVNFIYIACSIHGTFY